MSSHRMQLRLMLLLVCGFLETSLGGCRDRGPERVIVSGTVTYNGKPLPDGEIRFTPVQTSSMPGAGAFIVDGAYKADSHGGVAVGSYKIAIESFRNVPWSAHERASLPPLLLEGAKRQQFLPARYNERTQLEIAIPPGSGPISKNFDLSD